MMLDFNIPEKEIEKRRQLIRDVWAYKKVDHIPVILQIESNPFGYTMHDELFSPEKQLKLRLAGIKKSLALVPDDYIPGMFVNIGCVGIENALGMEMYYGLTPDQTPGVKGPLLTKWEDVQGLKPIDPYRDGILPRFLERMRYFLEETGEKIPVSCLDMNGPMAVAMDVIGSERLMLGMYERPDDVRRLLDFVMDNIMSVTQACVDTAGGLNNVTCTDFCDLWFPEGKKGHVSDDVCAMYSPEKFTEFSIPVNNRVFEKYGPGLLHNCGPNPSAARYLEHNPPISGVDLAYAYSKDDLPNFRKPFKRKGVIYLTAGYDGHEKTLAEYQYIIDALAPDVIAILRVILSDRQIDSGECDVGRLYADLRKLSEGYAARMW